MHSIPEVCVVVVCVVVFQGHNDQSALKKELVGRAGARRARGGRAAGGAYVAKDRYVTKAVLRDHPPVVFGRFVANIGNGGVDGGESRSARHGCYVLK